jgi:hypothetical protein
MVQHILEAIFEKSTPPTQVYVTHTATYVFILLYVSSYYRLMSMVERVLGPIFENVTSPTQTYVTRWGSDPCVWGGYSLLL